jgi:hypothetical protein
MKLSVSILAVVAIAIAVLGCSSSSGSSRGAGPASNSTAAPVISTVTPAATSIRSGQASTISAVVSGAINFNWRQKSGVPRANLTVINTDTLAFTSPNSSEAGDMVFTLRADDGNGNSSEKDVIVNYVPTEDPATDDHKVIATVTRAPSSTAAAFVRVDLKQLNGTNVVDLSLKVDFQIIVTVLDGTVNTITNILFSPSYNVSISFGKNAKGEDISVSEIVSAKLKITRNGVVLQEDITLKLPGGFVPGTSIETEVPLNLK